MKVKRIGDSSTLNINILYDKDISQNYKNINMLNNEYKDD